jgi:hypothetical protein
MASEKPQNSFGPKYVSFVFLTSTGKTSIWEVAPTDGGVALGSVKWFGRWRCYAFFAHYDPILEKTCLRDIANFCELETKKHRKNKNVANKKK